MSKAPKLRFKEFSGDWESKKLGTLGQFLKGSILSKADLSEEGKPCVLYGELYTKYNEVIKNVVSKTNLENDKLVLGQKNDVLIPSSGETAIDIATASCLQQDDVILGGDLNVFRSDKVNGVFASYQLNSSKKREIARLSQGASVVHIYNDQLRKIKLSVPSKEEQEKIASFFSLIDDKISLQGEKLEMLKDYKKGMMQKIFSRELRFKDDNGRDYPQWEEKKLGELDIELVRGPFGSALTKSIMVPKGKNTYKVYEQKHAIQKEYNIGTYYINQEKYEELKRFEVKPNDYIMSCSGTIGELYKIPNSAEPGVINQALLKITVGDSIDEDYFLYVFKYNLNSLETKGSGIKNITSVKFLKDEFEIPIPYIDEQEKISKLLINIDRKIEKEQEKLDSLNEYKKGLLQQMFV